jgi:hypothetical protein
MTVYSWILLIWGTLAVLVIIAWIVIVVFGIEIKDTTRKPGYGEWWRE